MAMYFCVTFWSILGGTLQSQKNQSKRLWMMRISGIKPATICSLIPICFRRLDNRYVCEMCYGHKLRYIQTMLQQAAPCRSKDALLPIKQIFFVGISATIISWGRSHENLPKRMPKKILPQIVQRFFWNEISHYYYTMNLYMRIELLQIHENVPKIVVTQDKSWSSLEKLLSKS